MPKETIGSGSIKLFVHLMTHHEQFLSIYFSDLSSEEDKAITSCSNIFFLKNIVFIIFEIVFEAIADAFSHLRTKGRIVANSLEAESLLDLYTKMALKSSLIL